MFRKIMVAVLLFALIVLPAFAEENNGEAPKMKFFKGFSASFNVKGGSNEYLDYNETLQQLETRTAEGVYYNMAGSVSFGIVPSEKELAGLKLGLGYANRNLDDDYGSASSYVKDFIINAIGNTDIDLTSFGLDASYINPRFYYNLTAFYRYKLADISFIPGLNLWVETKGIFRQSWEIKNNSFGDRTSTITLRIHPIISYDLDESMSISTSIDAISLFGQYKVKTTTAEKTSKSYAFGLQPVNAQTVIQTAINISVIKKF